METEQKIQNQDMEQGQKIQEQINQENQQIDQQITVKKSVTISHRKDHYGEYTLTKIYISAVAEVKIDKETYKFNEYKSLEAYLYNKPQEVIQKVDQIISELESTVLQRAQQLLNLDQELRKYFVSRKDIEVHFK